MISVIVIILCAFYCDSVSCISRCSVSDLNIMTTDNYYVILWSDIIDCYTVTDLSDSCVLALDDMSPNYAGDVFSNSDSYPALSHMLSPSVTQASSAMQQQQQPPPSSTVHRQATSNCHINQHSPSTISTQQRQNLHALGEKDAFMVCTRSFWMCSPLS